ncbi:hypothetical protein F511_13641 [Dorcoceras hygrometricum]|uniref:Uncharacterized protein n=1 Tax=Dorcoceras hygrometricum TaxID=472368 RepID=A0A2Z7B3Z4_9LAMI|nr:hypothetical protein F511_13641 [Dorcoceras hygrometricum]
MTSSVTSSYSADGLRDQSQESAERRRKTHVYVVSHTVEAVVHLWSLGVLTAAGCGIGSVHKFVLVSEEDSAVSCISVSCVRDLLLRCEQMLVSVQHLGLSMDYVPAVYALFCYRLYFDMISVVAFAYTHYPVELYFASCAYSVVLIVPRCCVRGRAAEWVAPTSHEWATAGGAVCLASGTVYWR